MNIYEKQHPAERRACSITYVNIMTAEERWPGPLLISPVQMAIKEKVSLLYGPCRNPLWAFQISQHCSHEGSFLLPLNCPDFIFLNPALDEISQYFIIFNTKCLFLNSLNFVSNQIKMTPPNSIMLSFRINVTSKEPNDFELLRVVQVCTYIHTHTYMHYCRFISIFFFLNSQWTPRV